MQSGLDDVIAAETVLSDVDGQAGRLVVRGHSLDELAGGTSFEDVAALLVHGFFELPPGGLAGALGGARAAVFDAMKGALPGVAAMSPFDALRVLVARLDDSVSLDAALALMAAPAVILPAVLRQSNGLPPVAPDSHSGHAADILQMLHGTAPSAIQAAALDAYLVTIADHGLNASTFTARVIASTQAGLTSSVLGALGALKGPLHGGAPGPVLDMLDAIGTADNAEPWLAAALDRGERLMGFGHRIYRVRDPRADALARALRTLREAGLMDAGRLALATAVEQLALETLRARKPGRRLETNDEFYTALLLEALGFPRESFTAVFAIGRTAGWIAHAREQALSGRLIRPKSTYVGPLPKQAA
jgi:citrate synthase